MTIKYRGTRDNNRVGGYCRGKRFAEVTYRDEEGEQFEFVLAGLRKSGWTVDDGVANWALIEVADKEEFEELMKDWKYFKKAYAG